MQLQQQQQIPYGDDNKKGNGNYKCNDNRRSLLQDDNKGTGNDNCKYNSNGKN